MYQAWICWIAALCGICFNKIHRFRNPNQPQIAITQENEEHRGKMIQDNSENDPTPQGLRQAASLSDATHLVTISEDNSEEDQELLQARQIAEELRKSVQSFCTEQVPQLFQRRGSLPRSPKQDNLQELLAGEESE